MSVRSFVRQSSVRSGRHGGYIHPTISQLIHVNLVILVIHDIHVMVMMIMMIMMVMMIMMIMMIMLLMMLMMIMIMLTRPTYLTSLGGTGVGTTKRSASTRSSMDFWLRYLQIKNLSFNAFQNY